jgi:two-component system, OmpR family, copper resistance phosphate regulon response regulator CusR
MRILLADRDHDLNEFVKKGLAQEGFIVEVVSDGHSALNAAIDGEHDAILLDTDMPEISGYEVLKKLRTQGNEVPILIIGASKKEQDMLHVLNNGADDYIMKPFRLAEVIARLRAILRRTGRNAKAPKASTLRAGKLELNLLRRELKCTGKLIYLTKVEFDLTEYFMRRSGEVISQNVLWQHLYGNESNLDSNSLPVHIRNLRRKIDCGSTKSLIRTVRGCGYALDV